ncbi:MAG TPA: hypothetical protein VN691_12315, partial [Steroidobacteraceae bacterium]|nr:hypothetical protein [Steroidobacteraceae bacterium]
QMARSRKCITHGVLLAVTTLLSGTAAFAANTTGVPLAVGPVEHVNLKSSTIVVLGQTYSISPAALSKSHGSAAGLSALTAGTLVIVSGTESASGKAKVQSLKVIPQLDVPGATQLLITGVVTGVSDVGQIRIGKLNVDINATLTSDKQPVAVGELVQVAGTQPTGDGLFLAQSVATGIQGTGATTGIQGTGATIGIQGTGASIGIQGTGATTGIQGTGASIGIQGTGASIGIQGTGATTGIQGTGATIGIQGTGASIGIQGTGATTGIQGTGTSIGIQGTGATIGIQGTGAKTLGIRGTG